MEIFRSAVMEQNFAKLLKIIDFSTFTDFDERITVGKLSSWRFRITQLQVMNLKLLKDSPKQRPHAVELGVNLHYYK